jgi:hypothetical protein
MINTLPVLSQCDYIVYFFTEILIETVGVVAKFMDPKRESDELEHRRPDGDEDDHFNM